MLIAMRRRRHLIVLLCLSTMLWCQAAMAVQACHAPAALDSEVASVDCHGRSVDADAGPGAADAVGCPAGDLIPDLGKFPVFVPLVIPAEFAVAARHAAGTCRPDAFALARDGPDLAQLCRLLI